MKIRSVCQFTLIALPVSYIVMLCGLTLSKWPLFIYDPSLKPPLQILLLFEVLWPALFAFLVTAGVAVFIRSLLLQLENSRKPLAGGFSIGSVSYLTSISSLICLWLFFAIMISYYIYRWHDVFMFYYYHLLGDIIFITGLFGYIALLSFFIIKYTKYSSKSILMESSE